MNIEKGVKAKVFDPDVSKNRSNTVIARISTKEGKDENGSIIYSSWYTRFVGDAYLKAQGLAGGEWIELTRSKVHNDYNKEKEQLFVTVTIFDFDVLEKQ